MPPGDRCLHWVYRYDRRGRRIGHEFVTTIDAAGARTVVDLDNDEMAIVVKLPAIIDAATPVNAIVTRCDEQAIDVVLNGVGTATITGPDGKVLPIALDGQQQLTICPGSAG